MDSFLLHLPCSPIWLPNYPKILRPVRASNIENATANAAAPTKKPRAPRKKPTTAAPATKRRTKKKTTEENKQNNAAVDPNEEDDDDEELGDYDDGIDFPYEDPPLVCCFGPARREFVPMVRAHHVQMHQDIYSTWKQLQWDPPEFARAPGGAPNNVAVSHVRLGGRAAFMGKVGKDDFGEEMVMGLNKEMVQTRGVRFVEEAKTARSKMRVKFDDVDGRMRMEVVEGSPEDSLLVEELNIAVLKEARILHFNSEALMSASMRRTLYRAIRWSKKFGGLTFFDPNLPLPLWKSRDETKELMKKAWNNADIIEVSRDELEFLLDDDYYQWKRNYKPQYYSETFDQMRGRRNCHHYSREELSPLWHDGIKFLFVTDGTLRIHYYTPQFDGMVIGTEDVLITPFTCDRTGSGDAIVAAIMRKLTTCPEMHHDQDVMERQIRFCIAAGIISQWTIGAIRGFPTESATQNLKEQVYIPSLW